MRSHLLSALTTTALLGLAAFPSSAQTTPSDLLSEWQQSFSEADQALQYATREDIADGLRLTNVTTALPVQGGKMRVTVPELTLTDIGGGEVRIGMPGSILVVIANDEATVAGRMTHEVLDLRAGGTSDARSYFYGAGRIDFEIDTATDENGSPIPLEMTMALEEVATDYESNGARLLSEYTIGAIQLDMNVEEDGAGIDISYRMTGLSGDSDSPSGTLFNSADPSALFASGDALNATLLHSGSGYTLETSSPDANMIVDGSSAAGALNVAIGPEGLAYDIASQGGKMRVAGDQLPFPVEVALDSVGLDLSIPILADPAPQPFGLRLALGGLTASQGVWSLFDPAEVLPRDPTDLVLDLSGTQRVLQNLTDADPENPTVPFELLSLNLNELLLSIVGATLTGQGGFEIDPKGQGMFPGVPAAVGSIDLELTGANALIDRLVQIGIMQPQDVMGLRMMMGMATRPGDTPDSLVSTIELTPNGGLVANGMQLR